MLRLLAVHLDLPRTHLETARALQAKLKRIRSTPSLVMLLDPRLCLGAGVEVLILHSMSPMCETEVYTTDQVKQHRSSDKD